MSKVRQQQMVYLAAVLIWAVYCLHLGLEGLILVMTAATASNGMEMAPFHAGPMAVGAFAVVAALLVVSARRVRKWSRYLLLIMAACCVIWFGNAILFGLPLHVMLLWAGCGLALLGLAVFDRRLAGPEA